MAATLLVTNFSRSCCRNISWLCSFAYCHSQSHGSDPPQIFVGFFPSWPSWHFSLLPPIYHRHGAAERQIWSRRSLLDIRPWLPRRACGSRSSLWHSQPLILAILLVLSHCSPQWPCPLWLQHVVYLPSSTLPFTFTFGLFVHDVFFSPGAPFSTLPAEWLWPIPLSRFAACSCQWPPSLLFPECRSNARALPLVLTDVCSCLHDVAYHTQFIFSTTLWAQKQGHCSGGKSPISNTLLPSRYFDDALATQNKLVFARLPRAPSSSHCMKLKRVSDSCL